MRNQNHFFIDENKSGYNYTSLYKTYLNSNSQFLRKSGYFSGFVAKSGSSPFNKKLKNSQNTFIINKQRSCSLPRMSTKSIKNNIFTKNDLNPFESPLRDFANLIYENHKCLYEINDKEKIRSFSELPKRKKFNNTVKRNKFEDFYLDKEIKYMNDYNNVKIKKMINETIDLKMANKSRAYIPKLKFNLYKENDNYIEDFEKNQLFIMKKVLF